MCASICMYACACAQADTASEDAGDEPGPEGVGEALLRGLAVLGEKLTTLQAGNAGLGGEVARLHMQLQHAEQQLLARAGDAEDGHTAALQEQQLRERMAAEQAAADAGRQAKHLAAQLESSSLELAEVREALADALSQQDPLQRLVASQAEQVAELEEALQQADELLRASRQQLEEALDAQERQHAAAQASAGGDAQGRIAELEAEAAGLRARLRGAAEAHEATAVLAGQLQQDLRHVQGGEEAVQAGLLALEAEVEAMQAAVAAEATTSAAAAAASTPRGHVGRASGSEAEGLAAELEALRSRKLALQQEVAGLDKEVKDLQHSTQQQQQQGQGLPHGQATATAAPSKAQPTQGHAQAASPARPLPAGLPDGSGSGGLDVRAAGVHTSEGGLEQEAPQQQVEQLRALLALQHDITEAKDRSLAALQQTVATLEAALVAKQQQQVR